MPLHQRSLQVALLLSGLLPGPAAAQTKHVLSGRIVDADSLRPIAARLYILDQQETAHHAQSAVADGRAVPYEVIRGASREIHTSLSPHPFRASLPAGRYRLVAERGKEYFTHTMEVDLTADRNVEIRLRRWIDMAERGWFSGETHVHRRLEELPLLVAAEDLNVALPLTYWVTDSEQTPATGNRNTETLPAARLIAVDERHVIWPVNTEYEIFTIAGSRHTLGAIFFLNHRTPLDVAVPPVRKAAELARREGALVDLDKHNWPWSMMLIPVAKVDLFELTNNHVWRTDFLFRNWYPEYAPEFFQVERDDNGGFTEKGWIDFGLQTYYTLLNCGFRLKPTAGTASGVHPVPLGYGRVYVQLGDGFRYSDWIQGLGRGNSFATTGPMLMVQFNNRPPGATLRGDEASTVHVSGEILSADPLERIEVVVSGTLHPVQADVQRTQRGAYRAVINETVRLDRTAWIAVRGFARRSNGRVAFAHCAPVHVEHEGRPLQPSREEIGYLIGRVEGELKRHRGVLSPAALADYEQALKAYRGIAARAK